MGIQDLTFEDVGASIEEYHELCKSFPRGGLGVEVIVGKSASRTRVSPSNRPRMSSRRLRRKTRSSEQRSTQPINSLSCVVANVARRDCDSSFFLFGLIQ